MLSSQLWKLSQRFSFLWIHCYYIEWSLLFFKNLRGIVMSKHNIYIFSFRWYLGFFSFKAAWSVSRKNWCTVSSWISMNVFSWPTWQITWFTSLWVVWTSSALLIICIHTRFFISSRRCPPWRAPFPTIQMIAVALVVIGWIIPGRVLMSRLIYLFSWVDRVNIFLFAHVIEAIVSVIRLAW